jgi:V8-like Glu-specific endopeptidase
MAVIVYRKNEQGKSIGDVVGYVGLDEISGFDDPDLDASGITGYPADKPGGEMWTMGPMGTCPNGFWEDTDYDFVVRHDCDTTPGTSGAALLRIVPDLRARGVNVYGDAKNGYNGANVFMPGSCLYQSAMKWSGRCRTCKWWQILCRLTRPCVR